MSVDYEKEYETDIPKHKKKSDGKGTPRADHKHTYETAAICIKRMIRTKPSKVICKGEVCTICGRVKSLKMFWTDEDETPEDAWRKYPRYFMQDLMDKTAVKEEFPVELDVTCPNCLEDAEHKATWDGDLIYECPHCLCSWKAYKNEEGRIRITERYFFG